MATERTVLVRLKAHVSDFQRGMVEARAALEELTKGVNKSNDRVAWLSQGILGLGPAFVPLTAAAIPAVVGLGVQLGVAAGAAGVAILAFHGIGTALKAVDQYRLQPTQAHLEAMSLALDGLGPSGVHFVKFLSQAEKQLHGLQQRARDGIFPGVEQGITHLLTLTPKLRSIVGHLADGIGQLTSEAGANLAGPKFTKFFDYLDHQARPILVELGHTAGNFIEGFANIVVAFGPLTSKFSSGLLHMSDSFAKWSRGLETNQGFQHFLSYIEKSGPQALSFIGELVKTLADIVVAAAPVGQVLLPALTALLHVVSTLANSPLGPWILGVASALSLYGRAAAIAEATTGGFFGKLTKGFRTSMRVSAVSSKSMVGDLGTISKTWMTAGAMSERESKKVKAAHERIASSARGLGRTAALVGAVGIAATGAADGIGLSNTASLALAGTMIEPGLGTAIGGFIGLMLDAKSAASQAATEQDKWNAAIAGSDVGKIKALMPHIPKSIPNLNRPGAPAVRGGGTLAIDQARQSEGQSRIDEINQNRAAATAAKDNAGALSLLASGYQTVAGAAHVGSESIAQFNARITQQTDLLTQRGSARAYQQSIDDLTKSIKTNGKTLDTNTDKGRQNQAALDAIASSAIAYGKTIKSGPFREKFMENARQQFIRSAEAVGRTHAQAKKLADQLLGVGRIHAQPKISVRDAGIRAKINSIDSQLNWLARNRLAHIGVTLAGVAAAEAALMGVVKPRTVSITQKVKKAAGGGVYGPGGPRDDLIPAWLSNGEHVWTAAEVAAAGGHGAMEQMRAMMLAGGYANGGAVNRATNISSSVSMAGMQVVAVFPGVGKVFGHIARTEARAEIRAENDHRDMMAGASR